MANRPAAPLALRDDDRPRLVAMTRSPSVRAGLAQRARILLLAADGMSNTEIADKVGVSRPTVLVWRERYVAGGLEGIGDLPRPGRTPHVAAEAVLRATLRPPPRRLGVTHWSSRVLGDELGIGRGSVTSVWRRYGLQPVRGGYRFATTPALGGVAVAVLALRLGPPEPLVLLDVRESTWGVDPTDDRGAASLDALAAALSSPRVQRPADPGDALLVFLDEINRARTRWPTSSRLHLVSDGTGPIGLPALREALAARSRVTVHIARDPERWPDMVAAWLTMVGRGTPAATDVAGAAGDVRRGLGAGEVVAWRLADTVK